MAVTNYKGVLDDTFLGQTFGGTISNDASIYPSGIYEEPPPSYDPGATHDCHNNLRCRGIFFRQSFQRPVKIASVTDGTSKTFMIGEDLPDYNNHSAAFYCQRRLVQLQHPAQQFDERSSRRKTLDLEFWWDSRASAADIRAAAQFCLVDGSVRFVSEIDQQRTYRTACTRNGGETTSESLVSSAARCTSMEQRSRFNVRGRCPHWLLGCDAMLALGCQNADDRLRTGDARRQTAGDRQGMRGTVVFQPTWPSGIDAHRTDRSDGHFQLATGGIIRRRAQRLLGHSFGGWNRAADGRAATERGRRRYARQIRQRHRLRLSHRSGAWRKRSQLGAGRRTLNRRDLSRQRRDAHAAAGANQTSADDQIVQRRRVPLDARVGLRNSSWGDGLRGVSRCMRFGRERIPSDTFVDLPAIRRCPSSCSAPVAAATAWRSRAGSSRLTVSLCRRDDTR